MDLCKDSNAQPQDETGKMNDSGMSLFAQSGMDIPTSNESRGGSLGDLVGDPTPNQGEITPISRVYSTDIDYDYLYSLDYDGVVKYAKDNFSLPTAMPFETIAKVMLNACKTVKLTPDNEQLLFILSNKNRILCEACAGSGKTTMSQMAVMKYKLIDKIPAEKILCLAYNNNAVEDMISRHTQLAEMLNVALKKSYTLQLSKGQTTKEWSEVRVSPDLRCKTLHSLSREWIETYASKLGINPSGFILDEEMQLAFLDNMIPRLLEKHQMFANKRDFIVTPRTLSDVVRVYGYAKETLTRHNPAEWSEVMPSGSGSFTANEMLVLFDTYELMKKNAKKLDFNDLLDTFYQLLRIPSVCERVRMNYNVILVDEYQDVTPAMLRIIKIIAEGNAECEIERYTDLHLICVGDTDQSIYGYRGTDPRNCIRFREDYISKKYNDTAILSMSTNRRCAKGILTEADKMIRSSAERVNKPILGIREGGQFNIKRYKSPEEELDLIVDLVKDIPIEERGDTVICFRNNSSSQFLSMKLFEQEIPYRNLKSSQALFSDKISMFCKNVISLFGFPDSKTHMFYVLYRVIPTMRGLTKLRLKGIVDALPAGTRFWDIKFPADLADGNTPLKDSLNDLHKAYKKYKSGGTYKEVMPELFNRFEAKKNIFFRNLTDSERQFNAYMRNWFTQDITVSKLSAEKARINDKFEESSKRKTDVKLSTFHGLKGLEFKNVIVMDLDSDSVPGIEYKYLDAKLNSAIGSGNKTEFLSAGDRAMMQKQMFAIREESKRLLYVAITRAKDRCWCLVPYNQICDLMAAIDPTLEIVRNPNTDKLTTDIFRDQLRDVNGGSEGEDGSEEIYSNRTLLISDTTDAKSLTLGSLESMPSLEDLMSGGLKVEQSGLKVEQRRDKLKNPYRVTGFIQTSGFSNNAIQQNEEPPTEPDQKVIESLKAQTNTELFKDINDLAKNPNEAEVSQDGENLLNQLFSKENTETISKSEKLTDATSDLIKHMWRKTGGTIND